MVERFPLPFGRYTLIRKLGEGGMGDVFLAQDELLETHVAVKIPKFECGSDRDDVIARFYREARAMARIPHHAHICPVRDVGEYEDQHFLVMAYIEGVPLSDVARPLAVPLAIHYVATVAEAMQVAHDHQVIHRDLKPANILLVNQRTPVVMDFGLARRGDADDSVTTTIGRMVGTPAYMSLEQVEGKREHVGPRSDIYSLGVVLYELLAGVLPFQGSVFTVIGQILSGKVAPVTEHNPSIAPELDAICRCAMARSQDERFPTMQAFAEALRNYARRHCPPVSNVVHLLQTTANRPRSTLSVKTEEIVGQDQKTLLGDVGDTGMTDIAAIRQSLAAQTTEEAQSTADHSCPVEPIPEPTVPRK